MVWREMPNPSLYVLYLWHHNHIDKSDPAFWFDLEVTDATHDL
jgi:hypothetical protein